MSYQPEALPVMATPNVIPMADIMLVLLIIFMVITPMFSPGAPVDMAKAAHASNMPNADRDDAIILSVSRDGRLFLSPGNMRLGHDQIAGSVKNLITGRLDKTVYVRSDARAKYGDVIRTVEEVRGAGVECVGLLTEKIQNGNPPPPPHD